jgi:hypothetical protein
VSDVPTNAEEPHNTESIESTALKVVLRGLQSDLGWDDVSAIVKHFERMGAYPVLVMDDRPFRLRIDGNLNHGRLAGNLKRRYDKLVSRWIETHRARLLQVWDGIRSGAIAAPVVAELMATRLNQ